MESGTAEKSSEAVNGATAPTAAAPRRSRSSTPRTGRRSAASPSTRPRASPRPSPGCAPTRPSGRRSGSRAATTGSASCATGCSTTTSGSLDTMQAETGKVRGDTSAETVYLTDLINFYGTKAAKFIGDETVRPHSPLLASKKLLVQYRPHPVVGVISPWNFPLALALGDAIPALQAGAAVVVKPSEFTPLGLIEVVEAWKEEIGGPDVFDCVHGTGETGGALIDDVDFIQFTGSDRTGRKVMAPRRRDADPGQPRARRQGPDDRPLRRRPRPRRQRRGLGRDVQLRPGLHLGRADLRRGAGLRRVRRQADQGGRRPAPGRRRPQARKGRRRDDLAEPDRRSSKTTSTTRSPTAPGR